MPRASVIDQTPHEGQVDVWITNVKLVISELASKAGRDIVGPKAYHPSFDDDQLMKLCLLMILCLISDRFIIKILVGA